MEDLEETFLQPNTDIPREFYECSDGEWVSQLAGILSSLDEEEQKATVIDSVNVSKRMLVQYHRQNYDSDTEEYSSSEEECLTPPPPPPPRGSPPSKVAGMRRNRQRRRSCR